MEQKPQLKNRLCVKCEKIATKINGADIPVCDEHDMEKENFLKKMRDEIGYSVI